ncbi:MAG: DUF192 domain-containing protein [Janthinobacterium lividum]
MLRGSTDRPRCVSLAPFARIRRSGAAALLALLLGATLHVPTAHAQPAVPAPGTPGFKALGQFPSTTLSVGMYLIKAEVAANDADREQGLMYRKSLAPNSGMLFVFDDSAGHCFWMKNTEIPLSIAFIMDDGTISDIDEMQAETENNHCPTRAIRYTLEMEKGWFTRHGIKPGMQFKGLPGTP